MAVVKLSFPFLVICFFVGLIVVTLANSSITLRRQSLDRQLQHIRKSISLIRDASQQRVAHTDVNRNSREMMNRFDGQHQEERRHIEAKQNNKRQHDRRGGSLDMHHQYLDRVDIRRNDERRLSLDSQKEFRRDVRESLERQNEIRRITNRQGETRQQPHQEVRRVVNDKREEVSRFQQRVSENKNERQRMERRISNNDLRRDRREIPNQSLDRRIKNAQKDSQVRELSRTTVNRRLNEERRSESRAIFARKTSLEREARQDNRQRKISERLNEQRSIGQHKSRQEVSSERQESIRRDVSAERRVDTPRLAEHREVHKTEDRRLNTIQRNSNTQRQANSLRINRDMETRRENIRHSRSLESLQLEARRSQVRRETQSSDRQNVHNQEVRSEERHQDMRRESSRNNRHIEIYRQEHIHARRDNNHRDLNLEKRQVKENRQTESRQDNERRRESRRHTLIITARNTISQRVNSNQLRRDIQQQVDNRRRTSTTRQINHQLAEISNTISTLPVISKETEFVNMKTCTDDFCLLDQPKINKYIDDDEESNQSTFDFELMPYKHMFTGFAGLALFAAHYRRSEKIC